MSSLFNMPWTQAFDSSGNTLAGAKLYFYEAGTTTALNVYADAEQTTELSNPVVADGGGRFVPIYVGAGKYKVALYAADDTLLWTADNVENQSSESQEDPDAWSAIVQTTRSAGYSESDAQNPANFPKAISKYASASILYNDIGTATDYYVLEPIGDYEHPDDYYEGMRVRFYSRRPNSGAIANVVINDWGNKTIKYDGGHGTIGPNEILGMVELIYDGTDFILNTQNDGRVGDVKMSVVEPSSYDKRWLLCNGRTLSSAGYPELYAMIGTTFNNDGLQPLYGDFQIPNYQGAFLRGFSSYYHGTIAGSQSAGLPNISGSVQTAYGEGYESANGAFETSVYDTGGLQDGGDSGDLTPVRTMTINFNASKSNSIYGASDTVTPANKPIYYYIKAF